MRILFICLLLLISTPAYAQSNQAEPNISNESVKELIQTLESESARKAFIDNLKTLAEVENQKEEDVSNIPAISQALGVEEQTQDIINSYTDFLKDNNLNSTSVGKAGLTVIALIGLIVIALIVKKITRILLRKLLKLKTKYHLTHSRFGLYARIVRYALYAVLFLLFISSIGLIWNVADFRFLQSDMMISLIGDIINVATIIVLTAFIWEVVNGFMEYALRKTGARNSSRTLTLLPIIRKILFIVFFVFFGLMLLSEFGINIMPLLAGAGVLGIAVGFGAQTVVKDFLIGFTIIMEDLIQVGDVVTLNGCTGVIELVTIRKVQLRNVNGSVYTVPFNKIDIIENLTKVFSYYLFDIGIAYREDPDEVCGYLNEIDESMRKDEKYSDLILEPLEILGVDNFADSAVVIKARIKTKPSEQWVVGREFNRRMKLAFDENKVEMPFPHQTIYFGEDKDGKAPAAPVVVKEKEVKQASDKNE